jgi:hypothetical protein
MAQAWHMGALMCLTFGSWAARLWLLEPKLFYDMILNSVFRGMLLRSSSKMVPDALTDGIIVRGQVILREDIAKETNAARRRI